VPWARDASTSFLATPREMRALLCEAGFEIVSMDDRTDDCIDWFHGVRERAASDVAPLGIHLLLGERFPEIARQLMRNLTERRVVAMQIVCRRPDGPRRGPLALS